MGIIDKIVSTAATNAIIRTVGETTLVTTGGIIDKVDQHKQNTDKSNSTPILINVFSVNDYVGENYLKARNHLIGLGFSNITLVPKKDLVNGWLTKDGTVEEIVIGGISEFKRKTKFSPDTPVMITYHTFKKSTASVTKSSPKPDNNIVTSEMPIILANHGTVVATMAPIKEIECVNCHTKSSANSKFCPECGTKLEIKKPAFCTQCGEPLTIGARFCANCGTKV